MENKRKIRVFLVYISIISMILSTLNITAQNENTNVIMDDVSVTVDGSVFGFLMVNDVSGLGSCDVTLSWDPDVLSVTDVGDSDFIMNFYIDDTTGTLIINGYSTSSGLNGDVVVAKITFESASGAVDGDDCVLEIVDSSLYTDDPVPSLIVHDVDDGLAQVYGNGIAPLEGVVISMDDVNVPEDANGFGLLKIMNVTALGSCDVKLSWDSDVVSVIDVNDSEFDFIEYYINDTSNILIIIAFSYNGMNGDIILANITFESVSDDDECLIEISNSELWSAEPMPSSIDHINDDGKVKTAIKPKKPSGGNGGTTPPSEVNVDPVADASASERFGYTDELVYFDGSNSYDSDGSIVDYSWDFKDGTTAKGKNKAKTFTDPGTYKVTLTVTDDDGATDKDSIDVVITEEKANNPPTNPIVNGPKIGQKNIEFDYNAVSTDADDDMIKYTFIWDDGETITTEFLSSGISATQSHSWTNAGRYIVKVTANDNKTNSGTTEYVVLIDSVELYKEDNYIGYMKDEDSDNIYDTFQNKTSSISETDVEKQDDGTYLIDSNADGEWDKTYDPETQAYAKYTGVSLEDKNDGDNTILYIAIAFVIIILILFGYLVKRGKK